MSDLVDIDEIAKRPCEGSDRFPCPFTVNGEPFLCTACSARKVIRLNGVARLEDVQPLANPILAKGRPGLWKTVDLVQSVESQLTIGPVGDGGPM